MHESLHLYFASEKFGSLIFLAAGILGFAIGVVFLFRGAFLKGMAYPLIAVAWIHFAVGATVYLRTDDQVTALAQQLHDDPATFRSQETQRMAQVNANFDRYREIELALAAFGALALMLGLVARRFLTAGLGGGLALQAGATLLLDLFAERRADLYTAALLAL